MSSSSLNDNIALAGKGGGIFGMGSLQADSLVSVQSNNIARNDLLAVDFSFFWKHFELQF